MRSRGDRGRGRAAAWLAMGLLAATAAAATSGAQTVTTGSNPGVPWPAADALGRRLPVAGEAPGPRPDRFVGIFYFLWHNDRGGKRPDGDGPYDVSRILARDPDALGKPGSPPWGPVGMSHYWAEPLYGYYLAEDPWVLRRHARLLADAGVDTLVFDTTNALTYPEVYNRLFEVFREIRGQGGRTPQVAFMVNTQAGQTARLIFEDVYKPGKFRELWFLWKGKPLLICDPAQADPEVREFFTLRGAHWPFTQVDTPYAWHWEAAYPQVYGYTDDPRIPEQVNVSVAQNLRVGDGRVTNMSAGDARGRSFHDGRLDRSPGAVDRGDNFREQWARAFELDPPFAMVTGWNEWVAGRWGRPEGPALFVDQYDREFSRDIEPMKGGHGDNYYYQLVANVRRYKGVPAPPKAAPRAAGSPGLAALPVAWDGPATEFVDDVGDTLPRDFDGAGGLHYVDRSGRNDLAAFKVATDRESVAFLARTRGPLTPHDGPNWMWLLIDADRDPATGWEGFDYIVNRSVEDAGTTWLEKNDGGWRWRKAARLDYRVADDGRTLQLTVPRAALGLAAGEGVSFDFKWADNLRRPGEVMDFYVSGDVAPEGRFLFRYASE